MLIFSSKKRAFVIFLFILMLVYRAKSTQIQENVQMSQYLRATKSIDIIVGDFNCDLCNKNKFLDNFKDHFTYIWILTVSLLK